MISVIIPSRCDEFLQKTVDDLLNKSEGEVEIIVVLDGYWPETILKDDPRVKIIHHGTVHDNLGMRETINRGVAVSKGKYILKADEHTMWDQGWDKKLIADCEDNWVVIPRRYRLDAVNWLVVEDGRPPIDYMYLTYPYERPFDWKSGLHGFDWRQRHYDRKDILIDDTMSCQGSAYFMTRKHWDWLGGLSEVGYGTFTQEAQEIGNKTWLGGGRMIVNKNTWYAHLHKGKSGKKYGFSNAQYREFMRSKEAGRQFCIDYWVYDQWKDRKYDFEWLVEKFWPIPGWPENWKERLAEDSKHDFRYAPK